MKDKIYFSIALMFFIISSVDLTARIIFKIDYENKAFNSREVAKNMADFFNHSGIYNNDLTSYALSKSKYLKELEYDSIEYQEKSIRITFSEKIILNGKIYDNIPKGFLGGSFSTCYFQLDKENHHIRYRCY